MALFPPGEKGTGSIEEWGECTRGTKEPVKNGKERVRWMNERVQWMYGRITGLLDEG